MSCCEIIPNNSVHWAVSHDNRDRGAKTRPQRAASPAEGDPTDVVTVGAQAVRGRDSIEFADLGAGAANHPGRFRVTLRFANLEEAKGALDLARRALDIGKGPDPATDLYEAVIDIVARPTTEANTIAHPRNPYAQICVVW